MARVQSHVAEAQLLSAAGDEPRSGCPFSPRRASVPSSSTSMRARVARHGGYGVSVTSMEEVFLRPQADDAGPLTTTANQSIGLTSTLHRRRRRRRGLPLLAAAVAARGRPFGQQHPGLAEVTPAGSAVSAHQAGASLYACARRRRRGRRRRRASRSAGTDTADGDRHLRRPRHGQVGRPHTA